MSNGNINAPFLFIAIFSFLALIGMVLLLMTSGARIQQSQPSNSPASSVPLSTVSKGPEHHPEEVVALKREVLETLTKTDQILNKDVQ